MRYLIDSDWVADFLAGHRAARSLFQVIRPRGIAISIITFIEIYEGIYYGREVQQAERAFRAFLQGTAVLGVTRTVARRTAHIRGTLRRQGRSVSYRSLDLIIAATAISHDLTLVTRNVRDYQDIPDLRIYGTPSSG